MESFTYQSNPARVIFGSGTIKAVPDELARLNLTRPFLLCTPQQVAQVDDLSKVIGSAVVGKFTEATMHTPVDVTEKAVAQVKSSGADCVISIGGGSTIGLGKAISFRTGLYHLTIPTTYAGSEVTPILGETENGLKTTKSDPKILPGTVVYDVDLTMTLPVGLSMVSGINAIAHAVEALYAQNKNPIISLLAQQGVKALAGALPGLRQDPQSPAHRRDALYGAWLCGTCLGNVGMSLHHKLCHTLGGTFNLPHAETHTIVLPHALAYNAPKVPEAMRLLDEVLPGSDGDATRGLNNLLESLGENRGLKDFGMKEEDVARAAKIATKNAYWNPREVERAPIEELIRRAWAGEKARADL